MSARSQLSATVAIEHEICASAKAARLRLRFDKVVRRLAGDLKTALADVPPEGRSVVITVTAPIRHPAKTAEALKNIVRDGLAHDEIAKTIHGNKVRIRPILHGATDMPRILAFVHNAQSDARLLLELAEARLLRRKHPGEG